MLKNTVAIRMRIALKEKGITQDVLSEQTKINRTQITRYFNGQKPELDNLVLIANALNKDISYFVKEIEKAELEQFNISNAELGKIVDLQKKGDRERKSESIVWKHRGNIGNNSKVGQNIDTNNNVVYGNIYFDRLEEYRNKLLERLENLEKTINDRFEELTKLIKQKGVKK